MADNQSLTSSLNTSRIRDGGESEKSTYRTTGGDSVDVKVPRSITKLLNQLHQGLFSLLFALQRKNQGEESHVLMFLLEVFELLQLLSFPFRHHAHFKWNHEHTNWFIVFVNATVPETFIKGNATIFYIVLVILGMVLLNAGVVGYYFSKNQFKFAWTLRYLRGICKMFMTLLYIPVVSLFASMLVACTNEHGEESVAACWSGLVLLRSVVVIIVSLLYIALTLTFALSVFQQDPTDRCEILSRPHSRIEVFNLSIKTILAVLFVTLEEHHEFEWFLVSLCVGTSVSALALYTWFLPFYRWNVNVLRVSLQAIFAWASICVLIVTALDTEENSMTVMFFIMCPLIIHVAVNAMKTRKQWIKQAKVTESTNPCTIELKARFILEDAGVLFNNKPDDSQQQTDLERGNQRKDALKEVTELYTMAAKDMPNSSILYMFWSLFCLYHCNNKQRSLIVLAECSKRYPMIDEEFVTFRQRKIMNEESSSENTDMLEFILCESYMKRAVKHERQAVVLQLQFWGELSQQNTNLQKLFALGSSVNAQVTQADQYFSKAVQSNPKSSSVLRSYANFLSEVCNDAKRSEELAERAKQIDDMRRRANSANDGVIDVMNIISNGGSDNDAAIVTINHKGIILSVNAGFKTIFQYERPQALLGENISVLVPSPFDRIHNQFLDRYMNAGEGQIISKLRKIFGVRADGYLVPAMLCVRQMTFGTTAKFLGVFKAVPEGMHMNDYILMDAAGFIMTFTEGCTQYFGATPDELARYQSHISDWIENYDDVSDLMKESDGHKLTIEVEGQEYSLHCSLISTTIAGKQIMIMKLMNSSAVTFASRSDGTEAWKLKTETPMMFYVDANKAAKKDKKLAPGPGKTAAAKPANDKSTPDVSKSNVALIKASAAELKKERSRKNMTATFSSATDMSDKKSLKGSVQSRSIHSRRNSAGDRASNHPSTLSQTSTTLNRMMRTSFSRRIDSTSQRLKLLKLAFALIFFATAVLAVVHKVVFSGMYDNYVANMKDISLCGDNYADMLVLVRKLRLFHDAAPTSTQEERVTMQQDVLSLSNTIALRHFQLQSDAGFLSSQAREIFTDPSLTIHMKLDGASLDMDALTLSDAVNMLVARASLTANYLVEGNATAASDEMQSASSIVIDTLSEPIALLMQHYLDAYASQNASLTAAVYAYSIIPIAAIYAVCIFVILSIFVKTTAEAKVLYRLFLDVPKDVIVEMYRSCAQRLANMEQTSDGAVLGTNDSNPNQSMQMSGIFQLQKPVNAAEGSNRDSGPADPSMKRNDNYEFANLKKVGVRFLLYVAITSGYFIGMSVFAHSFFLQTSGVSSYLVWSSQARHLLQNIHYRTMTMYTPEAPSITAEDYGQRSTQLEDTMDSLDGVRQAYMYGNASIGMPRWVDHIITNPLIGFPKAQDEMRIVFDDVEVVGYSKDFCNQFRYGSIAHGLVNALDFYTETAYDILSVLNSQPQNTSKELSTKYPPIMALNTMASACLPDFFDIYTDWLETPVVDVSFTINNYVHITLTVLLAIVMMLMYTVVFRPLMNSIEREVALTPSMLLMLPAQVLMKVESIRAFTNSATA